jgi:hypothetical protein
MYFDDPSHIISPRNKNDSIEDDTGHISSAAYVAVTPAPADFHPISPQKPRSGRRLIVDESELLKCDVDDTDDMSALVTSDNLQTIDASLGRITGSHNRKFQRRDSDSSIGSEESEFSAASAASFGSESYDDYYSSKPPASAPTMLSKGPRLPPAYKSAPKSFASTASSPIKVQRIGTRRKPQPNIRNKSTNSETSSVATVGTADDSNSSSRSDEDRMLMHASSHHEGSDRGLKTRPSSPKYKVKGILRADSKRSASAYEGPRAVRFGRLTITEFPIILGDNPAVTSGMYRVHEPFVVAIFYAYHTPNISILLSSLFSYRCSRYDRLGPTGREKLFRNCL